MLQSSVISSGATKHENTLMKMTIGVTVVAVTSIGLHSSPVFEVCNQALLGLI